MHHTKAEFDAALSDFNARLTTFEAGINSKIDSQVSSYLDRNGIWNGKAQTMTEDQNRGVGAIWGSTSASSTRESGYAVGTDSGGKTGGTFRSMYGMSQCGKTNLPTTYQDKFLPATKTVISACNKSGLLCCFYNQAWAAVGAGWNYIYDNDRFFGLMYRKTGWNDVYSSFTPTFGSNYFEIYTTDETYPDFKSAYRARKWCISEVKLETAPAGTSTWTPVFIDTKTIWEQPFYVESWFLASGYSWHPDVRFINFFVQKGDQVRLNMKVTVNDVFGTSTPYAKYPTSNTGNIYGWGVAAKINAPEIY